MVAAVNRRLVGWADYFSVGTLSAAYDAVDDYMSDLLRQLLARRHKTPGRGVRRFTWQYLHQTLGLVRLEDRLGNVASQALG